LVSLFLYYLSFETLCFHSLPRSFLHIPRLSDFASVVVAIAVSSPLPACFVDFW
jgi:hypothetical protein